MEKKIIRDEALSLEGDGIIPKIYSLLAYKDPSFGTMPSIYLPDTVMFSFNMPEVWYFGNDKGVRKKLKVNVTLENIEKAFLRNVSKNGIAAQYITLGSDQKPVPLTFTYILKDELRTFLHSNKPNGILQKFVNPKGLYNYVLKVNWSPNFCLFEKVENLKKLDDDTTDLYQRTMTLEGRDYQTRTIPLRGSVLPHKLEKLAYHVSHHIKNATMENIIIARMTLVFKIDAEGKLWFLYCTSLRVQPYEDQINENQHTFGSLIKPQNFNVALSSPSTINAYKSAFLKTKSLKKVYKCQNCEKDLDYQQFFDIPLHQVINEYEKDRQIHYSEDMKPQKKVTKKYGIANRYQIKPEELDVSDATIPKIVMKMYPDLKQNEYDILRREPGFLYEEVKVCEDCYLQFSNNFEYVQDPKAIAKEYQSFIPKGTGSLRPELLDQRRNVTQIHGKINNNDLGVLLRACKQKKCAPMDYWEASGQSERSVEKEFPEMVVTSYRIKRDMVRKANLHSSMSLVIAKETSQPKITEEDDPFDHSVVEPEQTIQVKFSKAIEEIPRKVMTSQLMKRQAIKSKSPQKNIPVFLKSFYMSKNLIENKNLKPLLPQVGPKSTKKRIESPSPDAHADLNFQHAFTMTHFRQAAKMNSMLENSEYTSFSKSKDRIMKTYAGKSFNTSSLIDGSKADITIKDSS